MPIRQLNSPRPALDLLLSSTCQILPEIRPMHHPLRLEALRANARISMTLQAD